ncbi:MAG: hypothetical protein ACE5DK_10720 [Paracoccaceae bacterium]
MTDIVRHAARTETARTNLFRDGAGEVGQILSRAVVGLAEFPLELALSAALRLGAGQPDEKRGGYSPRQKQTHRQSVHHFSITSLVQGRVRLRFPDIRMPTGPRLLTFTE